MQQHIAAGHRIALQAMARVNKIAASRQRGLVARTFRRRVRASRVRASRTAKIEQLHSDLEASLKLPLNCSPHPYEDRGAALFIGSNWLAPDGTPKVVLGCNSVLPRSLRRIASLLWTRDGIAAVDLSQETLHSVVRRGRVLVFISSVTFANGDAYAVLPAAFQERPNGKPGLWTFATAGSYRGQPFILSSGAVGTFADSSLHAIMLARPVLFDSATREWIWVGRSSAHREGKIRVLVGAPLESDSTAKVEFELPASRQHPDLCIVRCTARDDQGDPLGVVDKRSRHAYGITRIEGTLHFFARPNQRDRRGRLLFAARCTISKTGESVLSVPFSNAGSDVEIELPANHILPDGSKWFVQYPNVKDRTNGLPLVLVALRKA